MASWSKYPFVRILVPFALGIWCRFFFAPLPVPELTLMAVMALLFAFVVAAVVIKSRRLNWLFGVVMGCYLVMAGYSLTRVHEASVQRSYFRNFEGDARYYVARVYEPPKERDNSVRALLELEYQFGDTAPSRPVTGKAMAYFQKSDSALALRYGDLIAIAAPIGEVAGPKNPEEFDYRSYLLRKGVTGHAYLKDADWIDLHTNQANPLFAFSYRFRDKLIASLRHCGLEGHELGVAAAILLGYDDYLEDEMRQKYVAAGSMHILCVSGMHVGILYLVASFLLGFLGRKKWHKTLKSLLLLAFIWYYALIAGLSPSILRASLMISFVIIGEMIRRKGFVINSIAASAFILLCVNPNNLLDLGFLLSYSAVIGIVTLQQPIYRLLYVKNKLLDRAWEITAVALAAQLATLPFTLFYFQQFTTYFWLSNLFMTPISFLVVMGGMLLLLVSWIPFVNVAFGYLVWGMIYVMNFVVAWIDRLPFSIIKGLYVSEFEFLMLLTAFLLLLLGVVLQKRRLLVGTLTALLLLMVSVTVRHYRMDDQSGMAFFSLRNHTAVDCIKGGQHVLVADALLSEDASVVDYSLKGFWAKRNLSPQPEVVALDEDYDGPYLRKKSNLVTFEGKLLALWDDNWAVEDSLSYRLPVDYLLVTKSMGGGKRADLQSITNGYDVGVLLIDGTVPQYLARQWEQQAALVGLPCQNLGDGAWLVGFGD